MPKNDQQEAYEKLMSANHARMIDFSKFAEAKNAALLTFCSVWMGGIITLLRVPASLPFGYSYAFAAALIPLFLAVIISLKSLMPKFLDQIHKRTDEYRNLLYFGDIDKAGTEAYPGMASDLYTPSGSDSATATYLHDLAVQTAIHAKIAHRKFRSFNWAGSFVLFAFAIMMIPPIAFCIGWAIRRLHC